MTNIFKFSFIENKKYSDMKSILKDTYKIEEYKVWWKGQINEILAFYKQNRDTRNLMESLRPDEYGMLAGVFTPSFLKLVPTGSTYNAGGFTQVNNFTVFHNPVANIISRAKSNLISATEPIITVQSNKVRETKILQELVDKIAEKNDYGTSLQKEVEMASYSGGIAYKPILDTEFSDIPLYQSYDKGRFFVYKKFDKPIAVVFIDEYKVDRKKYILLSEHGIGYVNYILVEKSSGKEVPFNKIPELSELKPIFYYDKETKEPLDMLMAVYIENRPGFRSDYENSIDDFQALDESYSKMMDFIRKTVATRVVSQSTLKHTEQGEPIIPSVYDSNFLVRWDNTAGTSDEINELQALPDISNPVQGYISVMNELQKSIARTVGLSFKTITGEDLGGANASADALAIRENIDFRTRENMVVSWSEGLNKLYKLLLMLTTIEIKGNDVYVNSLEDIEISTEFYNPSTPTFEQEVEEVNKLIEYGLIDHLEGLTRLWVDTGRKSQQEVEEMYLKIQGKQKEEEIKLEETKQEILNEEPQEDLIEQEGEEDVE